MMRLVLASSLRFRVLVVGAAAVVLALGLTQLRHAPVDVLPEFAPPYVQIQTEALGLSAAEVEQLITVPMEQDLLNGVPWLDKIRSESMPGLSSVELIFEPGTNVLRARQMVQERLTQVHGLPNVGSPPQMIQPLSSTNRVLMIGLSSKDVSLIEMSVLARWKIRPQLMGIPGVANVAIWGQRDRQLQVQVDPAKLRKYGVSLNQVIDSTGNALWVSPLTFVEASTPGTGGFIDTPTQRFGVQHVLPITTAKSLASVTLEDTGGRTLRLADVADVREDHQPLIGDALVDNQPSLMLVVQKFPEANTREMTKAVEDAMASLQPGLSGITIDTRVYRPASFIDTSLHNLGLAGLVGLVLVIVLLGAFFFSWRLALISFVAITLSLVAAASVLYLRGATFNVMVLAGLVAALGVVIDDAVMDVDNVRRRLRERSAGADGATAPTEGSTEARSDRTLATVIEACAEVRGPIVYATLILLLAAFPILFVGGVAGAFSRPLLISYALAVLASMVVALTVTPVLTVLLSGGGLQRRPSPLVRWLHQTYDRRVPGFVQRPRGAYATVAVLAVVGLAAMGLGIVPALGKQSVLPSLQDRDLLIHWAAMPGTSLSEMDRVTTAAARELRSIRGVRDVGAHLGRAVTSDALVNVNAGELWVNLEPSADYRATVAAVQRVLRGYPGLRSDVVTYPTDQVNTTQTGRSDDLVVRVYGQDFGVLDAKAQQIARVLSTVKGVVAPTVQTRHDEPTVEVEVKLAAAERHGLAPGDVRRAAATMLSGLLAGNLYEEQKVFDVVVWGTPAIRHDPTDVTDLLIDTPKGGPVRLGDVATVRIRPNPTAIPHDATSRSVDVTAALHGRNVESVVRDVQSRIRAVTMPLEYHAEVVGNPATERSHDQRMIGLALVAALGIFLLLQAVFNSWRLAALLFVMLPLAAVGGLLAGSLTGGVLTLGAAAGFLAVLGLAARQGIVLIRRYQRLEEDGEAFGPALVLRATRDRSAPIVLTALATAAAVLPLVLLGSGAGAEVLHPLAAVVVGGLVTSTLLILLVVPALYLVLAPRTARSEVRPGSRAAGAREPEAPGPGPGPSVA